MGNVKQPPKVDKHKEILATYHLDNPWEAHPMERGHFYDEQIEVFRKTGKPTRAVGVFNLMLFTENGEVIVQKRSHLKRHNAGLIDKAVGGHIEYGSTPYYTAMIECVQELRVPAVVLREGENLAPTLELLKHSLESTAILKYIKTDIYEVDKIFGDERIAIANNYHLFFGVYGGPIKPVDREASGIMFYEMDVLKAEMTKVPELFTPDLHMLFEKFEKEIHSFLKAIH